MPTIKMEDYMNNKRLWSMAVLLVFLGFPASASMVSFLLVETGLDKEGPSTQYTSLWEGGIMDPFFDAGYIITNSPIVRADEKPTQDLSGHAEEGFYDALMGGADYFIVGFLEYQIQSKKAVPVGMVLKIYRTDTKKMVYEHNFTVGAGKSLDEEFKIAKNAGRTMLSHMKDR